MRWDALFGDLEAQLAAADDVELAAEVADRTRYATGQLRLVDRLRPAVGCDVGVHVLGCGALSGRLSGCGADWLLLQEDAGREALVPLAAVAGIGGLLALSATPGSEGVVAGKLGLRYALRGIARDRAAVAVTMLDGSALTGTLDRVGADFAEIAEHGPGETRRPRNVRGVRTVPITALAVVRRALPA